MAMSDNLRDHVERCITSRQTALEAQLAQVLESAPFQGRLEDAELAPSIAKEIASTYYAFLLDDKPAAEIQDLGLRYAARGFEASLVLPVTFALQDFCQEHIDGQEQALTLALEKTDAYAEAWLHGYIREREAKVRREQAETYQAVQPKLGQYAMQMQTASEVARAASSILESDRLLETTVELIRDRFDLYYVGIFLLDESGTWAELQAGTGDAGRKMLADGHRLEVGGDSMIGQCVEHRKAHIALDVGEEAFHFDNPVLPDTHSEMALPLISRDEVIGAMTIQSAQQGAFSEVDSRFLQIMADQLANAIQNARLFESTQTALTRTSALYRAGRAIISFDDVDDLLGEIVEGIAQALNTTRVSIFTVDLESRRLEDIVIAGLEPGVDVVQIDFDELWHGLGGWAMREREPVLSPKGEIDPRESPQAQKRRRELEVGAIICVPILSRDEVLGVITAINDPDKPNFTSEDAELLMTMANQAAVALQNAYFLDEMETSLRHTEMLYHVANVVISSETISGLLQDVVEEVAEIVPANRVAFIGFDLEDERVTHFVRGGPGAEYISTDVPYEKLWDGLSGWVLRERKPALSLKGEPDPREAPEVQAQRIAENCGSIIVVPVQYQNRLLGTMTAINLPEEPDYDEQDVEVLSVIAGHIATAMVSVEHREELKSHALQLQTAAEVTQTVSSVLDIEDLLPQTVELVKERFDLYYAGIFLLDDVEKWAVLAAGTGEAGRRQLEADHRLAVAGDSMIGQSVSQQEPRIALDVSAESQHYANPYLPETRSEMALPLVSRGETLGAMTIQSTKMNAFDDDDITILETVAGQLANAISNARLFTEAEERYRESQALQRRLTGETWASYASQESSLGYAYDLSKLEPLQDHILPADLPASSNEEPVLQQKEDSVTLTAPITLRNESVGVLEVEDALDSEIWSEDAYALIDEVRDQVALALENRLLFQQTTEALTETRTLYEITRNIGRAMSVDEILAEAVNGFSRRPELDRVVATRLDTPDDPNMLEVVVGWSGDGVSGEKGQRYPLKYWEDFYEVFTEKGVFFTSDVEQDPLFNQGNLAVYRELNVRGMVALRITVRGEPYGMMLLYTEEPYEFSSEELRFYDTIIRAASVALENQFLIETTREEADRRLFLNRIMSEAAASLDPKDLMRDVGRLITEHFNMPTMLWQWDGSKAYPAAMYRDDGQLFEIESDEGCSLSGMPGVGAAIRWERPMLWDFEDRSYHGDKLFTRIVEQLDLVAAFSAPLMVRGEVLGLISLGRQRGHPVIDENEKAVLRSTAVNVGVALENATLYQEAQETAERLREVDRLKSEFLANMSHELRTPLNSIIGFSRVMLKGIDGPLTDMQQTDLKAIFDSGKHLLNLINDILDLSKIEAGKMEFVFEPTDLQNVIKGVMSTAIALVKEKPIELQKHVPADLPPVLADERRIRQVILNIVGNAAKFTEEGYINVSATYGDGEVLVAVEDTGIGIPPEKYNSVFQEFQQVDSSSTRKFGGTGLGLPVSKKFVEAHGGRIWFESEVNVGTTFYVALPVDGPSSEKSEESDAAEQQVHAEQTILTVDDDEGVITLFRRYLKKQGYHVVGLTRADRVVAEAKRIQPYAITLDILMPDVDGWKVIQALKSDPETRDIPIIVCSIVSDKDKGLSLGVADYLVKPILEQDLLDSLERLSKDSEEPENVMIVDDSATDRNLLQRVLEGAGYQVATASGGMEAISRISERPPDLLVLDLMMPEVDGFAVLETLRSNEATRQLPVVVVTAKELTVEERERLNVEVAALLEKGIFDQELLLQDVSTALDQL